MKLRRDREVSKLFGIISLEEMMRKYLKKNGIKAIHEYCLMEKGRLRYRLDFAILCRKGKIAIECDNRKWHALPKMKKRDRKRDQWLKSHGWTVIHFLEKEIMGNLPYCLKTIKTTIRRLN